MTILHALLLGSLQGLTEFFPVSSSGHLALLEQFFSLEVAPQDLLGFDVLLHAGTLLALLIAYRKRWVTLLGSLFRKDKEQMLLLGLLVLATIPGALGGLLFEDLLSSFFRTPERIALSLFLTALVLIAGEYVGKTGVKKMDSIRGLQALLIGIAQMFALIPGISRSGMTISTGRALGLERSTALDFSFLMAVPIIAGATAKTLLDVLGGEILLPHASIALTGIASSFIVSFIAIYTLKKLVERHSLALFAWYLVPVSALLFLGNVL